METLTDSYSDEGFQECGEETVDLEEAVAPALDPSSIPNCEGIDRDGWSGKSLLARLADGSDFALVIIITADPNASIDGHNRLGKDDVGIVVLDIYKSDSTIGDTCLRWPMRRLFYCGATGCVSVYDHARKREALDREVEISRKRAGKRKYRYDRRTRAVASENKKSKMLSLESLARVIVERCCDKECTTKFNIPTIRALRTEMHSQTFQVKSTRNLDVHRMTHKGVGREKELVTLEGIDVCLHAWRSIHNVSLRTFQRYKAKAAADVRGGPHGNSNRKKIRTATVQAIETLRTLLESAADYMPHLSRTPRTGEKVGLKVLPAGTEWNQLLASVNEANEKLGLSALSQSCFSKIRTKYFPEYVIKGRGDSFSRCSICDNLKQLRATFTHGSEDYQRIQRRFDKHLFLQEACRHAYYRSRGLSKLQPSQLLSIMHDKMDHSKTACPALATKTKALDGFMKLPIKVTGMFAHGHGDGKYAHYSLDVFPSDSNFTVGSIAKLLRDLEDPPLRSSRSLFKGAGSTSLYRALLEGSGICVNSLGDMPPQPIEAQPLPPVLHIQMDNSWRENKNRYVFCFWSLLVARRIVKEVVVSFMIVGHTHDDIDASFGRWSMLLHEKDYPTLPLLMQSYMELEELPFIPHLIEEVPNFKAYIKPYIGMSKNQLVGHSNGRQYKFFMDDNGWPIMQYKLACTDIPWLPKEGLKLWKADAEHKPMLPQGDPLRVKPKKMTNESDILRGLDGYIQHWMDKSKEDGAPEYQARMSRLATYWTGVRNAMRGRGVEGTPDSEELQQGFWPRTRQPGDFTTDFMQDGSTREEYEANDPYIGTLAGRPPRAYNVATDLYKGYYVFVRPAVGYDHEPVWLGRAVGPPQFDPEAPNFREVLVQWYKPCRTSKDMRQLYTGWDTKSNFRWKVDQAALQADYVSTDSIMASWKPKKNDGDSFVAPRQQVKFAVDNLRRIAEEEQQNSLI